MAITITEIAHANNKTTEATSTATVTVSVAVGDLILLLVAADNTGTAGVNCIALGGDSKHGLGGYTAMTANVKSTANAVNDGVCVRAFRKIATQALVAGTDTVSVDFGPSPPAKVWVAYKITGHNGTTPTAIDTTSSGLGTTYSSSASISGAVGDLIVAFVGNESNTAPAADTGTTGGAWSGVAYASAGSGGDATKMSARAAYKILTATSSDTLGAATGANTDWALLLYKVVAVAAESHSGSGSLALTPGFSAAGQVVWVRSGSGSLGLTAGFAAGGGRGNYPTIADADTSSGTQSVLANEWTLTYPANIQSGDLLVGLLANDGALPTMSWPTGWVKVGNQNSTIVALTWAKKRAVGNESGTSFAVSSSTQVKGSWRIMRIPAALWPGDVGTNFAADPGSLERSTANVGSATSAPGQPLNPALWDVEPTLWVVALGLDGAATVSAYPSAAPELRTHQVGDSDGAGLAVATARSAVASLTPGNWTIAPSSGYIGGTLAVRPHAPLGPNDRLGTGVLLLTPSLAGTGSGPEVHSGSGSLSLAASLTRTGSKATAAGGALTLLASLGRVGVKQAAAPALVAQDDFLRTTVDSWGTAPLGGAWTTLSGTTNLDVNGTQGTIQHNSANTSRGVFLQSLAVQDAEVLWDIVIDKLVTGPDSNSVVNVYVALRAIAETDRYQARLLFRIDGKVDVALEKIVTSVGSTLAGAPASANDVVAYGANSRVYCRVRCVGLSPTVVEAKVWLDGTAEPTNWTVTASDSEAILQAAGDIGVRSFVGSTTTSIPHTLKFEDLDAWNGSPPSLALSPVLAASGGAGTEAHSGAGSLSLAASLSRAGAKVGKGTGALTPSVALARAGAKTGKGVGSATLILNYFTSGLEASTGSSSMPLTATFARTGVKQGKGSGTLPEAGIFASTATRTEAHAGAGTLAASVTFAHAGKKAGAGVGTLAAPASFARLGRKQARDAAFVAGTFGTTDSSSMGHGGAGVVVGTRYALASGAYVTALRVWSWETGFMVGAVYAEGGPVGGSSWSPGALVVSDSNVPTAVVLGWNDIPVPSTWLPAGDYWLAINDNAGSMRGFRAGSTNQSAYNLGQTYGTAWPSTYPTPSFQDNDYVVHALILIPSAAAVVLTAGFASTGTSTEFHSGTGTLAATATFARAGSKAGKGAGALPTSAILTRVAVKGGKGAGALPLLATFSVSDFHEGQGALAVVATFARAGRKQGAGVGSLAGVPTFARTAVKAGKGTGTLAESAEFAVSEFAHGSATLPLSATFARAGAKTGKAAPTFALSPTYARAGTKAGKGAGTTTLIPGFSYSSGTTESHTGTGALSLVAGFARAGVKSGKGVGALAESLDAVTLTAAARRGSGGLAEVPEFAHQVLKRGNGVGAHTAAYALARTGTKAGRGAGVLAESAEFSASGAPGEQESHSGAGVLPEAAIFAHAGTKRATSTQALPLSLTFARSGSMSGKGAGSVGLAYSGVAVGKKAVGAAGTLGLTLTLGHSTSAGASGSAALALTAQFARTGYKSARSPATCVQVLTLAHTGTKASQGSATLALTLAAPVLALTSRRGVGAMMLVTSFSFSGTSAGIWHDDFVTSIWLVPPFAGQAGDGVAYGGSVVVMPGGIVGGMESSAWTGAIEVTND